VPTDPTSADALREALRELGKTLEAAGLALFRLTNRLKYPDLSDWEDEMDNCYPEWPGEA
jgi:hypothetical protein